MVGVNATVGKKFLDCDANGHSATPYSDDNGGPTIIIAIWRGGVPIGIAVQEFLAYCGIDTDHIAIRTSSYGAGIDQRLSGIRVHGLNYLIKNVTAVTFLIR